MPDPRRIAEGEKTDIADASRWAAERAAHYGIIATARRISPDDPRIVFEAHRAESPNSTYERAYALDALRNVGTRALANEFVELARMQFPEGETLK